MARPVVVVGLGKSGIAACRYFARKGKAVVACDERSVEEARTALSAYPKVDFVAGPFSPDLFASAELLVVSPGVDPQHPAVAAARNAGVVLTNEPSVALGAIPLPVLAITGSSGKTTTATLAAAILEASGRKPFLGGNIGSPLLDLLDPVTPSASPWRQYQTVVAELSSFQLELLAPFHPSVAILTTLGADHLNRHGTIDAYHAAKTRLFSWLGRDCVAVLGENKPFHDAFARATPGQILRYAAQTPARADQFQGAWRDGNSLVFRHPEFEGRLDDLSPSVLLGANAQNFLAAAIGALSLGATEGGLRSVASSFAGLPHRLEYVGERRGVRFVNDSKATNVAATATALSTFPEHSVILLAGGKNKGLPLDTLSDAVRRGCRYVVAFGESGPEVETALSGVVPLRRAAHLADAVAAALEVAEAGDVVLLSPACASHDEFRDYAQRGDTFRSLVQGA